MIDDLVNDLVRDEGSVKTDRGRHIVYDCPAGLKTIGYGIEVQDHGLSEREARLLLKARIEEVIAEVDINYPFMKTAPHPIQKAVYNMAFNLGITRLSKFKNMITALEEGNYDKASIEAEDSKWFKQTKSRAERIVLLMKEAGGKFYD
tara:strand:+ start:251 stop:694 length:444 start_codon:yes stop_codon:yes gene_type:complete